MTGSLSPGRACPRTELDEQVEGLLARIRDLKAQRDRAIQERNGARSALRQQIKHHESLTDALLGGTTAQRKRRVRKGWTI